MPATFRCYQLKRSKDARKRCINLMSPKYSVIVAENKGFSSRNYLGLFLVDLGLFCHFFARLRAITLVSKPPLVTQIARTGLGTRLTLDAADEDVNRKWNVQFLELISIMPQHRPEVATVKTRSLAASLNGGLVFLFSVQKLLFVQDFRSILLQETHLIKCF